MSTMSTMSTRGEDLHGSTHVPADRRPRGRRVRVRRTARGAPATGGAFGVVTPPGGPDGPDGLVALGDLWLPPGFRYRIISREGDPMSDGTPTPASHDGMAV
ncbi:MAG: hypothetical protein ACRDKW_17680, partial [Actinomycetota bacterium]